MRPPAAALLALLWALLALLCLSGKEEGEEVIAIAPPFSSLAFSFFLWKEKRKGLSFILHVLAPFPASVSISLKRCNEEPNQTHNRPLQNIQKNKAGLPHAAAEDQSSSATTESPVVAAARQAAAASAAAAAGTAADLLWVIHGTRATLEKLPGQPDNVRLLTLHGVSPT